MNSTRREFLKSGAALPLAMQSLHARAETAGPAQKNPPRRIIFICNSLGFYEPYFTPKKRGDLDSSQYLSQFATPDKLTVFQNLFHPGMETSNHDSEKSFLTGVPRPESPSFQNSESVDQVLARHIGNETRFQSLAFSIYDRGWGCAWNKRGVAIPPLHDEALIFEKLFGAEDVSAKKQRLLTDRQILASLHRDLRQLETSSNDAAKVDSYRTVISELEKQIAHEQFWLNTKKPQVANSLSNDREFEFSAKIGNLLELAKLAFQTDSTRVITISLDWIYGAIKVPGATGGWHTLSHHGGRKEVLEQLSNVETEIVKRLNRFLVELDEIPEGSGTLLDQTTVVIGSNFGDASNHTCNNLPTIVAGGGFQHQQHTVQNRPTPLCNLWLELLHAHDVGVDQFSSSEADLNLLTR